MTEEEWLVSKHPSFILLAPRPPIVAAMLIILALVSFLGVYVAYVKYEQLKREINTKSPLDSHRTLSPR